MPHPTRLHRIVRSAPLALGLALAVPAQSSASPAQRSSDEVTPEVQRLYAKARDAQAHGDAQTAIAGYNQILRLAPRLAPAYNNVGMLYFNVNDFAHAAEMLRKGLAIDPNMATAQTLLGLSDYRLAHYPEAKAELTKALAADPGNNDAELALARIEINTGDPAAGTAHLHDYLSRNSRDQQAWYLLGKTYLKLSEDSLAKVDQIDPDSSTAHIMAGEVDESMKNYDGALAEYNKAVAKNPNQPGNHYHLGNAFWLEEKYESAATEFRAELRIDPGNCLTQWKLGNSILNANQPAADALPPLDSAVTACPDLMQARVDRANVLLKLDQPQKALDDLQPAAQGNPREPSIHFLLSRAYKALGRDDQARSELQSYGKLQREASEATAKQAGDVISVKNNAP